MGLLRARTLAGSQSLTEPLWPGSLSPLLVVLIACAVGLVSVAFLVMLLLRFKANKERHKPEPIKGDDEQQIAPLQQYPDGVLKLRSPQSEEKCPDVVLDVSVSDERLKEEEDRASEAVRWKSWKESESEADKATMARSTLQEYQPKNGGQTRVKLVEPVALSPTVLVGESSSPAELSDCIPPPLKYRQTIV